MSGGNFNPRPLLMLESDLWLGMRLRDYRLLMRVVGGSINWIGVAMGGGEALFLADTLPPPNAHNTSMDGRF